MRRFGMKRSFVLAGVLVASLAIGGVIASTGGARSSGGPRTITFNDTAVRGGFGFKGRPRPGERFGFTERVRGSDGSKGYTLGSCTLVKSKVALCNVEFVLNKGQLAAQVPIGLTRKSNLGIIVGGSGAYDGARGEGLATNLTSKKTRVVVHLLG
jgi:hypothetical protein